MIISRQQRDKCNTGYYHITIRGNNLEILKNKKENNRYGLVAFCIMDNRALLLLQEREEDIANIMKRINVCYVFYFSKNIIRVDIYFTIDTKVKKKKMMAIC